jgi:hypothetical protein
MWRARWRHGSSHSARGPRGGGGRIDNTAKLLSDTPHTLWTIFGVSKRQMFFLGAVIFRTLHTGFCEHPPSASFVTAS